MNIEEVSLQDYRGTALKHCHVFNTPGFSSLNAQKAEQLHCLLFEDGGKVRFGITLGERDGWLLSPFSAPFGGFSYAKSQRLECLESAVEALCMYVRQSGMRARIALPPLFYDQHFLSETVNVLSRYATLSHIDLNYHFSVPRFADYENIIARNARKNLHHANGFEWDFAVVWRDDESGLREAYDVIRRNREEHGYPLRMSLSDVEKTVKLIDADFFLLRHEGKSVAAAQVFHVADGIAQVIYWGDLRAHSALRPMNMLAYRVFEHYYRQGLRVLDIGPSTQEGIPNYGLCEFKSGIGCTASPKFIFEI